MTKTLGLDIGIGSIGTALIGDKDVMYMGVRMFEEATEASESRIHRSQRRNLSRKKWRKQQLKDAFNDFGIIDRDEIKQDGYLVFSTNNDNIKKPIDKTVYHLRKRALSEQISKRETLLCLYNMLHARGHFLLETIDFAGTKTITFDDFKEKFYEITSDYIVISDDDKPIFEKDILLKIFNEKIGSKDIERLCDNAKIISDEENTRSMIAILKLLEGYKPKLKDIDETLEEYKESCNVMNIKSDSSENVPMFLQNIVELYDMIGVAQIMKDHNYLCEVAVEKIDEFDRKQKETSKEVLDKYLNDVKAKGSGKHIRPLRNFENSFPNGLYVKEASAILRKQQNFYPEITDDFIEVCEDIISARIPYYIGPLNENGKNAWLKKNDNFKYSYKYSMEHGNVINEHETIKVWKDRMRSCCTYLPNKYALPVGSFIGETFNILNEINILTATDKNNDEYYLSHDDKVSIFDNLFFIKGEVSFKDVSELLNLKYFGDKNGTSKKFNSKYTLYRDIVNIIPELKLNSIKEFNNHNEKINTIEDIILNVNLYDEEKTKFDYFDKECGYSKEVAKRLSKLKSKSFYSYSREFIFEQEMDENGNTLIDKLFENNTKSYKNEQMTLITMATDKNGNRVDYVSNKYIQRIKNNNNELNYKILVDKEKPVIPVSRPVLRSLNECMKMYLGIVEVYGAPDRIVIEMARDMSGDKKGKKTLKTSDYAMKQYLSLKKQLSDKKDYKVYSKLESYDEIGAYLNKNKDKILLYISQLGVDMLTGEAIKLNNLDDYEIDHILPRGFGDDSMDDKMLIAKKVNAKKANRLPIEFIESNEGVSGHEIVLESEFIDRVKALYDIGAISEKKYKRLILKNQNELDEFLNQDLVDTRYIIREFMSILKAYNEIKGYKTHIVALKSAYTNLYRKAFNMDKERGYGDQHHAHDAALLCIADRSLLSYYPAYDSRKIYKKGDSGKDTFSDYNNFIKALASNDDMNEKEQLNRFVRQAYRKAFCESAIDSKSIINKVKNYVPYYSLKVERNYKGKFFNATIMPQFNKKNNKPQDLGVLGLLGVNNDKHIFGSIECVAVDFYKFTNSKGKKEHLAVHIPKVIVNSEGIIDKGKYIKLIKERYKKPEILDENGNIKEGYFKFRAFKNDLMYSTSYKTLLKFNVGSIAINKLEFKYVNIFSYTDIYEYGREISNKLCTKFNIKTKTNKDGVTFSNIEKADMVYEVNRIYWGIDLKDKKLDTVIEKVENDKSIYDFSNHLAYIGLIINRPGTPPTIDGQYLPVVGSALDSKDEDARYVKLKYNILGIRANVNGDGGLDIYSPIGNGYSKITKEKFSWQVSRNIVE